MPLEQLLLLTAHSENRLRMHNNRQETNRMRQHKLAELRYQLRFATTEAERRVLVTQIDFWRRQP